MNLETTLVASRPVPLDVDLVLAGQGIRPGSRPGERVLAAAQAAVTAASDLVDGRFVRAGTRVRTHRNGGVDLAAISLDGDAIAASLEGAELVVATICTIGRLIDEQVSALLRSDPLGALAFDGLGSAACERLAAAVCAEIEEEAAARGLKATGPLSPGMIGWPLLDAQRQVFRLVDPASIGVVLTPAGQMIPRKSLSFVVGVGPHVRRQGKCAVCRVQERCRYASDKRRVASCEWERVGSSSE